MVLGEVPYGGVTTGNDDNVVSVDVSKCREVAPVFRELIEGMEVDDFTDPRFYPPRNSDPEIIARYFIFMVAIDHRTSRYRDFEGYVDGQFYHGADLLYRLGMIKLDEDPEFFSPERMSRIDVDDVRRWLRVRGDGEELTIWDPDVRADLLKDLGVKIINYYGGSCLNVVRASNGFLKYCGRGFIERLKIFRAYSDPVEKKAYLLTKFLSRRGILEVKDLENAEVPVDNHLTRIAIRLGIVRLSKNMLNKILMRHRFSEYEDIKIRLAVRQAFKVISKIIDVSPLVLDDLLWTFGRYCCIRGRPICVSKCYSKCGGVKLCMDKCPFINKCLFGGGSVMPDEHLFEDTFYY